MTEEKYDRRTHEKIHGVIACRQCPARAEFDYVRRRRRCSVNDIALNAVARKLGWAKRIREDWTCPACWEKGNTK